MVNVVVVNTSVHAEASVEVETVSKKPPASAGGVVTTSMSVGDRPVSIATQAYGRMRPVDIVQRMIQETGGTAA